ncbi:HIT-like domain-containing protein [Pilobolus umbonatus]|nr:HIT-like domain-containing protein [Pilobolus umbonatus]
MSLNIQYILNQFVFTRTLSHDTRTKLVYVLGRVDEKDCILSFEKTQYEDVEIPSLNAKAENLDEVVINNIYGWALTKVLTDRLDTRVKVIYPATETHILKYESQPRVLLLETPSLYQTVTLPYIKSIPKSRLEWLYNILNHKAEIDRIIHYDKDPTKGFVILPDMKWDGHSETLYWVAIPMRQDLYSVRSLSTAHLPLLENMRNTAYELVKKSALLRPDQLRLFIHYQPSYYHFHIHITAISFADAPGIMSGQAHLLDSVIDNIRLYPDYYQRATLPFMIGDRHPLAVQFRECSVLSP